jgi:hypothetical protein
MAKVIDKGYKDTPVSNPVPLTLTREPINFGKDFRVYRQSNDELWLTNVTSPIDRPERLRIARKEIANVYQGTDISPSVHAPSKKGVNLHLQLQQTVEVTDSTNPEFLVHVPITTSITIKTPASYMDAGTVMDSVERLLTGIFETNSESSDRLAGLLRGSLIPMDI